MSGRGEPRLLPWVSPEGKTCFLLGDGKGFVSRMADRVEAVQLEMADGLVAHADGMLGEARLSEGELRFLARNLTRALRDVRRVAVSRGARLGGAGDASG
ncbi:hypothetical protein SAZ_19735 [Streptomyces noursei ZPM]|uniref:Uncharacterized protein n=1 Tax=Streptomyces noursei TaxID=1971 RepID=A0A059VXZ9_STRNR|nr:hypothetical protein [Streptomyces noursei]AKA04438.1 hypothetical protein SAZ_19735 [Streptomyces noursei ZPM]EXU91673.1 hypothetical protein P354_38110 [Streptomyces noursei PD-1]AIA04204.1 hypothetical protein DC74_3713 [Streptomyces noursei]MCZ0974651.1 hypothetical protein [Streptomyces noursei]UWS72818.1 hypothetical protein N1H47_17125 [Streptomyces noursei]